MKPVAAILVFAGMLPALAAGGDGERVTDGEAVAAAFASRISVESAWKLVPSNRVAQLRAETAEEKPSALFKYYRAVSNDTVVGYAAVDRVEGKHGPIRFLVLLAPDLSVAGVTVLELRERRGRGIRAPGFLAQFVGRRMGDPLSVGADIDGITGATVSSEAITKGVKRATAYLTVLVELESR